MNDEMSVINDHRDQATSLTINKLSEGKRLKVFNVHVIS